MNTNLFAKVTMAAALAVATNIAAFGIDSARLTAKVDFPFKAFTANMAAGHYELSQNNGGGGARFHLRNLDTRRQIILIGHPAKYADPARPSLTFRCGEAGCGLIEVSSPDGYKYQTISPKWNSAEKERLVTVYFDRVAGE